MILITNDDGVSAKGIAALIDAMRGLGALLVVAPDGPRSGQSSAITPNMPLRLTLVKQEENLRIFKTNGTPVDCIKLALHELLHAKPDLIVSGINHGSNSAVSILYSGTMGAVLEGCVVGVPSIGFSLSSNDANADFDPGIPYIRAIAKDVLTRGLKSGICLNVNIPKGSEIKGVKVCRQAMGRWTKEYEKRIDPIGKAYFWLTGYFHNAEPEAADTDEWALNHDYVSVVPSQIDMTAHQMIRDMLHLEEGSLFDI